MSLNIYHAEKFHNLDFGVAWVLLAMCNLFFYMLENDICVMAFEPQRNRQRFTRMWDDADAVVQKISASMRQYL